MTDLPRKKPDPIPAIHPLPEYLAVGARKAVYEDTKAVLGVPWMGVVTMAFSHYPGFYGCLWSGLRPLCRSGVFQEACHELRRFTEDRAASMDLADLRPQLEARGYAARECADIRAMIEVFGSGNYPYLLIATVARLLLAGGSLAGEAAAEEAGVRPAAASGSLILMERHHADAPTLAVYDDIQATLGLPFVNTDYRALARWPSYFALAWADLKSVIETQDYEPSVAAVHQEALRLAEALPNPGALEPDALRQAALADAPSGEVEEVVGLFQWLLPGLVTNVAGFQKQLADS